MWTLLRQLGKGPRTRRAVIVDIADAMIAILNDASESEALSQSFTASRYYVPIKDIKDLAVLWVSVVPTEINNEFFIISRGIRRNFEYTVDIGIQKVIGKGRMTADQINEACDPLMLLSEEITDLFNSPSLEGYEAAKATKVENRPIYSPHHVDEYRVFTSVVSVTFAVVR